MAGVWGMDWGWREGLAGMQETRLKATAGIQQRDKEPGQGWIGAERWDR